MGWPLALQCNLRLMRTCDKVGADRPHVLRRTELQPRFNGGGSEVTHRASCRGSWRPCLRTDTVYYRENIRNEEQQQQRPPAEQTCQLSTSWLQRVWRKLWAEEEPFQNKSTFFFSPFFESTLLTHDRQRIRETETNNLFGLQCFSGLAGIPNWDGGPWFT